MVDYTPLREYFEVLGTKEWRTSFERVEKVLGDSLPPSARKHRPWWGNETNKGRSQANAWMSAGWKVAEVDLESETVTFRKE